MVQNSKGSNQMPCLMFTKRHVNLSKHILNFGSNLQIFERSSEHMFEKFVEIDSKALINCDIVNAGISGISTD